MNARYAVGVATTLAALLAPAPVQAGCGEGDAPRCSGSCPNASWWSRYKAWCEGCGGKTYQNSSGGGCDPGSNWKGNASSSAGSGAGTGTLADSITQAFQATAAQAAASAQIHRESTRELNATQQQSADAAGQRLQRASKERAAAAESTSAGLQAQMSRGGLSELTFDLSSGLNPPPAAPAGDSNARRQLVATEKASRALKNAGGDAAADSEAARVGFDINAPDAGDIDTSAVKVPEGRAAREERINRDPRMVAAVKKLTDLQVQRKTMDEELARLKKERNEAKDKEQMKELTTKLDEKNKEYQKKLLEISKESENVEKTRELVSVSVDVE